MLRGCIAQLELPQILENRESVNQGFEPPTGNWDENWKAKQ
jgi:hypothetical protein